MGSRRPKCPTAPPVTSTPSLSPQGHICFCSRVRRHLCSLSEIRQFWAHHQSCGCEPGGNTPTGRSGPQHPGSISITQVSPHPTGQVSCCQCHSEEGARCREVLCLGPQQPGNTPSLLVLGSRGPDRAHTVTLGWAEGLGPRVGAPQTLVSPWRWEPSPPADMLLTALCRWGARPLPPLTGPAGSGLHSVTSCTV